MELLDDFIQKNIEENRTLVKGYIIKNVKATCIFCHSDFKLGELITLHESRDVYGKVYDRMYICRECNKKRLEGIKIDKIKEEETRKKAEEIANAMTHDSTYDSILGLKILDVLSNGRGDETDIILEDGRIIHIWWSEWGDTYLGV